MADRGWPDLAGRLVPGGHILPIRIYFEDTDFSGFVYHANYLRFMERGRSDLLRCIGINHTEVRNSDAGGAFAVHKVTMEFHRPARIDDVVEVETRPVEVTAARIRLQQTVRCDGTTLVSGEVTVVLVDPAGRARRLPAAIRSRMAAVGREPG